MTETISILIFQTEDENQIKEVFTLHPGENTIGSDNDCDIVIQLSDNSIESLHAKVIVNDSFNDIGIEDISISNTIYKEKLGKKIKLKKRREYELVPNRTFYLTLKMTFFLFEGSLEQIERFLKENNMGFYIDYLKTKIDSLKSSLSKNDEDDDNLSLEYRDKDNKTIAFKSEDFNNFDYIPGEDNYNEEHFEKNNEKNEEHVEEVDIKYKLGTFKTDDEKKILSELLDLPKDITELLPKNEDDDDKKVINLQNNIEEDFGQMLSERLRTRKKDNKLNSQDKMGLLNKKHKFI